MSTMSCVTGMTWSRTDVGDFFVTGFFVFFFRPFAFFFPFFRIVFERFFQSDGSRFRFGRVAVGDGRRQQEGGEKEQDGEQGKPGGHGRIHRLLIAPPLAKSGYSHALQPQ